MDAYFCATALIAETGRRRASLASGSWHVASAVGVTKQAASDIVGMDSANSRISSSDRSSSRAGNTKVTSKSRSPRSTCRSHESGAVDAQPLTRASAGRNAQLDRPFERRDIDASAERRFVDGHRADTRSSPSRRNH